MTLSIKDHLANAESTGMSYAAYAREHGVSLAGMYKARATERASKQRAILASNDSNDKFLKIETQKNQPRSRTDVVIKQMSVGEWSIAASGLPTEVVTRLMVAWNDSEGEN